MSRDPLTSQEWQEAVDAAEACLALESARLYGFITHNLVIDVDRCEAIIATGTERGIHPRQNAIERLFTGQCGDRLHMIGENVQWCILASGHTGMHSDGTTSWTS